MFRALLRTLTLSLLAAPLPAAALTLQQVVGLFHIVVGLLLTFIVVLFCATFFIYVARFNTWPSHRESAIRAFEWAVSMLFVLLVILAIVNAVQHHGAIALPILAFVVIVAVIILVAKVWPSAEKKPPTQPPRR